ncbi:hypothetical protein JCM5353_000524 [Sporobolomyces roseus]
MKVQQSFVLLLALSHQGLAWLKRTQAEFGAGIDKRKEKVEGHQDVLAAFESDSSNTNTLEVPTSPSCFFLALSSLPTTSPCETLAHSDSQRSEIAVRMALCEIGTAQNGRSPRECVEWSKEKESLGHCIESLSRSPQYWASYSGYLRDIVTHCSTFRRWADIELARELHKSSASTFQDVLFRLRKYEDSRLERQAHEAVVLSDLQKVDLAALSSRLSSSASSIQDIYSNQDVSMKGIQTELASLLIDLQTLPNELQLSLKSIAQDHGNLLAQLATVSRQEAQEVVVEHRTSLNELSRQVDQRLSVSLDQLVQAIESVSDKVINTSDQLTKGLDIAKTAQSAATDLRQAIIDSRTEISIQTAELTSKQADLSDRIDASISRAGELASALRNLTEQARSGPLDSLTSSWESLIDLVWWIRLLCGMHFSYSL